jgi:glyoxylase I family protein
MKPIFTMHHICLSVTDRSKSVDFYAKLGFTQVFLWESEDNSLTITHLKLGDTILELFCYKKYVPAPDTILSTKTDLPVVGTKHFGLKVESIQLAKEYLVEQKIIDIDKEIITGRTGPLYFFITDPDGIQVEIAEDNRKL